MAYSPLVHTVSLFIELLIPVQIQSFNFSERLNKLATQMSGSLTLNHWPDLNK